MNEKPLHNPSRLHDDTRRILIFAEASAKARGSFSVEFDDLLLGILRMPEIDASKALDRCAINLDGALKRRKAVAPLPIRADPQYVPYIERILCRAIAIGNKNGRTHALTLDVLLAMVEFAAEKDDEVVIDIIFEASIDQIRTEAQATEGYTINVPDTDKKVSQ